MAAAWAKFVEVVAPLLIVIGAAGAFVIALLLFSIVAVLLLKIIERLAGVPLVEPVVRRLTGRP